MARGAVLTLVILGLGLGLGLGCAGCRGADDDAPCSTVAARFLELARRDLSQAQLDPAAAQGVADQLPAMRDALAAACADGAWSAAIRRCLVHAVDHVGFETCEQQLTDEQRRDLGRADRAAATPPQ